MNPNDLINLFVLNEIGDDYESFEKITNETVALGQRAGLAIDSSKISNALTDLIRAGLAKAYHLSPWGPAEEIEDIPIPAQHSDLYFLATPKGAKEHKRLEPDWPFDDDGNLRNESI